MTRQKKKMDPYIKAVRRRLNMPTDVKERVMSDFISSIASRREAGQTDDQIIAELGTPKEAASVLNEQMKEFTYRKSPWRFVCLAGAVLGGLFLLGKLAGVTLVYMLTGSENASMGIIGGADGPTSIFVATSIDAPTIETKIVLAVLGLAACLFGAYKLGHMKRK